MANENDEKDTLTGKVLKILFPRAVTDDDNGFRIFIVKNTKGEFAVKGIMPNLEEGMTIACEGAWELHKNHGRQMKATTLTERLPADLVAIKDYLVKAKIGFGRVSAQRAVDAFGAEIFDILDREPERLSEIKGLKGKTLAKITSGWSEKRASHTIMLFLAENGVPPAMAHKVYKHMGGEGMSADGIIERLKANPYLIADVRGIGFLTADAMALKVGIPRESTKRACAAMVNVMREAAGNNGHTLLPWSTAISAAAGLLKQPENAVESRVRIGLGESSHLQIVTHDGIQHVALSALRKAGERIAKELGRLVSFGTPLLKASSPLLEGPIKIKDGSVPLDESQAAAVRMACTNPVSIITGRPGTGKTSSMRAIIDIADRLGRRIVCCAPTGLAAVRLSEATGMEASTIHRVLGIGQNGKTKEKINVDLAVGDETSMVDIYLMADFLEALPAGTSVVFVGDIDQLPSVGPGNVLGDLIKSGVFPVSRLQKIHRQSAGNGKGDGIVEGAHAIIEGRVPDFNDTDFRFVEQNDANKAAKWIPEIMKRMCTDGTTLDQIQVLSPMRERGPLSVANLNEVIQNVVNPKADGVDEITYHGGVFRVGDRVRQTKNDYELEIVNGDIGYIREIDVEDHSMLVAFTGERDVEIDSGDLENLTRNFCGTIHSSQGSEFGKVVIALHDDHFVMLNRNLLYTAVTRAKEQCVIVGTRRALQIACRTQSNAIRCTDLADLLRVEFQEAA